MKLAKLTGSQVNSAANVLARALHEDPLSRYQIPDAVERQRLLPHAFRLTVRDGILNGEVYATSPNLEGVAVWYPPGKGHLSVRRRLAAGVLSVKLRMDRASMRRRFGEMPARVTREMEYDNAVHQRLTPFPHTYLNLIGVESAYRGRGYAGALLRPMLARMDEEGLPCYLTTSNPDNVPLYEHFGFEVVEEGTIPDSDVGHWAMLRKPREG